MTFRLVFQIPGDDAAQLDRTLLDIEGFPSEVLDTSDPKSAGSAIADSYLEIAENQIETEGARGGNRFAPLSEPYASTKEEGLGILVNSGEMRAALTRPNHPDHVAQTFFGDTLTVGLRPGSAVHQRAVWHQSGTSRMPSRPPIVLTEGDRREWTREVLRDLRRRGS